MNNPHSSLFQSSTSRTTSLHVLTNVEEGQEDDKESSGGKGNGLLAEVEA